MLKLLVNWLLNASALVIVAHIVPGFEVRSFGSALLAAVVIGLINATLGLFLKIITFPLTIISLGIFWLVINALMLMLASALLDGLHVSGFWAAFFGGIVLAVVNMALRWLVGTAREK